MSFRLKREKKEKGGEYVKETPLRSSFSSPSTRAHLVNSEVWAPRPCIHFPLGRKLSVIQSTGAPAPLSDFDSSSERLKRPLFLFQVAMFDTCWSSKCLLTILLQKEQLRQLHWVRLEWLSWVAYGVACHFIIFFPAIRTNAEAVK